MRTAQDEWVRDRMLELVRPEFRPKSTWWRRCDLISGFREPKINGCIWPEG